jgi:hypothetical protein
MVGNKPDYVIPLSMISTLIFGALGFGVHQVLKTRVPEFFEIFHGLESSSEMGSDISDSFGSDESSSFGADSSSYSGVGFSGGDSASQSSGPKPRNGVFGDHIIIDKIAIKNEPKLMADAIRHLMSQDSGE